VVVSVDDGQGRRVLLGEPSARHTLSTALDKPLVAATHKEELRALIKALREVVDDLPDAPREGTATT
jgi:ABC-type nitrate/sulfonate/bicarbonate transport system substrate-binding protein